MAAKNTKVSRRKTAIQRWQYHVRRWLCAGQHFSCWVCHPLTEPQLAAPSLLARLHRQMNTSDV